MSRKKNSKQDTDQTVLTITKALTKTTNCTCRAKKWSRQKKFVCRTFKFVPAPLAIYSLLTVYLLSYFTYFIVKCVPLSLLYW